MTVEELLVLGKSYASSDHAKILLAELLNKNPLELLNYLDYKVNIELSNKYKEELLALKNGKPLQYVIGNVNFYGIKYYINENVLIPRFETEELVENTINYIKKNFNYPIDIVDLGCGSGVIGLTLEKKISTKSVDLIDISRKALTVTKKNIINLNSRANIMENNFLENINKKYDVIISNPPYIKTDEQIENIVKENEPHIALYGGIEGLDCYKEILKNINNNLKEKALIAFEIGSSQAQDLIKLINIYLTNVKIIVKKDLSGRDRMLFIFKNIEINE